MKKTLTSFVFILFVFFTVAQEKFVVPQLTNGQKSEVLYNHVIAYSVTGISFAKTQGVPAEEYGKFIGSQFKSFWDPAAGFPAFTKQIMYILAGMHPNNEMEIVEQGPTSITFRMKNVDLAFKNGPMMGISYDEFLACSHGIISVIADYMNTNFSHKMTDDGWYVVNLSQKG